MKLGQAARLLLLLLAVAAAGAVVALLAGPWLPGRLAAPGPAGFADLVTSTCAVALLACWCWLALGTVVVALEALLGSAPTPRWRLRWVPRAVRVLVPVLVGAAVGAAPATATASTEAGPTPGRDTVVGTSAGALAGLPVPDRALTRRPARPGVRPTARPAVGRTVLVRPGDTLWAITARLLPAGSAPSAVDRGWRRVALVNADRVPDPDLIRPGTRLRIPPLTTHPREEA